MDRSSLTPPAKARPSTSSSSISSAKAPSTMAQQPPPPTASSSRPPRGTTPQARPLPKAADGDKPTRAPSKDSLKQKMPKTAEDAPKPRKSDELKALTALRSDLDGLRSDFDGLRSHLTCKICDRLLYQPYTISCGHTYCYSCLCTWFVAHKARKTCPDCRVVVTQPPAPAYVIRDMTSVFVARTELLPNGETAEEHTAWQKEEADIVQQDKDNQDSRSGGLFRGCFRASQHAATPALRAFRDQEDGVDRCPVCNWELEDGECEQCGLGFNEHGELAWGDNSFNGFSDMDAESERDLSSEDVDPDMAMGDEYPYDDPMDGWQDYPPDDASFMMRRYLNHGAAGFRVQHRRVTHSEAGSRRTGYTQSIVSDMYTDEMDTVAEEDEDGDSSMNDFLDDDDVAAPAPSRRVSATPGRTLQPPNSRPRVHGRARRIVESESSSSISSSVIEEEEEDEDQEDEEEEEEEEDQGPIRRGLRNRPQIRAHTRILNRANGSRERPGHASSTSTDVSGEQELDEDTQALLQADGWMLQHDGPDEEMEEDDDESDGAQTTVGWDATDTSNDRLRMGGSLTPTADRPRPNAPIRPPSRVGNPRFMDASRGLRRRSSILSTSSAHLEDGEADDDNSDQDQDGDISMAMHSLRSRRSRAQLPRMIPHNNNPVSNTLSRSTNRGLSQNSAIDLDTDDNSDTSQPRRHRGAPPTRQREYNPRISWMFADHQRTLQEFQRPGAPLDLEPRSRTPIDRPRTANRNRPSPAQQYSPFMPPAPAPRLRTPQLDNSSNIAMGARGPTSPGRRGAPLPTLHTSPGTYSGIGTERAPSIGSISNASSVILTPGASTPISQQSANDISQAQAAAAMDMIDRPPSRVGARPPSAAGRRTATAFSPGYPSFPQNNVGLNMQNRILPPQRPGNPWGAFVQPHGIRTRTSRPVLRDQSSVATLRAVNSRVNIRDGVISPQMRTQASRIDLRPQPSRRRLNNQSSTRTLRASEHARPPQTTDVNGGASIQPASRTPRITPDELGSRARELVNERRRALGATNNNNPFTSGFRRTDLSSDIQPASTAINPPQHLRSNSNDSINSGNSSTTTARGASSPGLNRRRSVRNISAGPPPVLSPIQGSFSPPAASYTSIYSRPRQGSFTGSSPAYESPLSPNGRSPMVAATGQLI